MMVSLEVKEAPLNRVLPLLFSILIALPSAKAAPTVEKLAKDLERQKINLAKTELKQRRVLSALYELNKKIKRLVTDRGQLAEQKEVLEFSVTQLEEQIQKLQAQSQQQKSFLAIRLKAIYKLGGDSIAKYLLESKSSTHLERNLKILGIVASRDLDLLKNYKQDLTSLKSKKMQLAQRLAKLETLQSEIQEKEIRLVAEQKTKGKLLEGLRKSRLFAEEKIQALREKSLSFNIDDSGLFDTLYKSSFADFQGALPMPLDGPVTQKYGLIKGINHPYTLSHKGIFISGDVGSPVRSVFDGKIAWVGELPGFGKTLIVDHGDHYYSVYSHMQNIEVQTGDKIRQEQRIASVGPAYTEANAGLYFEIRHFSEPYDPQKWMKGL